MAGLRVDKLCRGWEFPVLDEISLEVAEGEFFVLVGPSGAGKTTLLRLVAGLDAPDAGKVFFGDEDVTKVPPYRRGAAMTFESYALYPQLSVFENIASPLRARRLPAAEIKAAVHKVAELLRIAELLERRPGEISGGQKQRTALGRTLVATPRVFLLDEPLSHLDAKIRVELREQFHQLEELRRTATLYVTHDYAEALSLADRVGVLADTRILQVGTPAEIFERPASVAVARQFGQPDINLLDVELAEEGGELAVQAGALRLPAPAERAAALRGAKGGLRLGLRPQHLRTVAGEEKGGLPAAVESFQSLGSYGVLGVDCAGQKLRILTAAEADHRPGDRVAVAVDAGAGVWFGADGLALEG
ncbi:MAG: ABC transporter ATP-binding protein [Betaproteobacteria bacterium AqS2]|uniref:ABC transporter ATP-binding protein n=1 Tax=Candidatus Amphirhobacter heronislandensis TaxID=1732024 RepID=A0A930XWR7_9GAMM|nr:ABC transporter ATP-binding protein [Betaproteobacteria bacterium AqS2]